jgi:hypothetical protein
VSKIEKRIREIEENALKRSEFVFETKKLVDDIFGSPRQKNERLDTLEGYEGVVGVRRRIKKIKESKGKRREGGVKRN